MDDQPLGGFFLILALGAVSSLLCAVPVCVEHSRCGPGAGCRRGPAICEFTNELQLVTISSYNSNASSDGLASMLRGVCAPGNRISVDATTGVSSCVPFYPFPDALNYEIQNPSASEPHRQACGAWIDAGGSNLLRTDVEYRSMSEHNAFVEKLLQAENAATSSERTAADPPSKFRHMCRRTAAFGSEALWTAAVLAYKHLRAAVDAALAKPDPVARAEGVLASHYCDGSTWLYSSLNGAGLFELTLDSGVAFLPGTLAQALAMLGETAEVQAGAERARDAIELEYQSATPSLLSSSEVRALLEEATGQTNFSLAPVQNVAYFVKAVVVHYARSQADARAYLLGQAAFCSYTALARVLPPDDPYATAFSLARQELAERFSARSPASALGRLSDRLPGHGRRDPEAEVGRGEVENATAIHFAQLGQASGDFEADCLALTRYFFPDDVESGRFEAVFNDRLYQRMQSMVARIRDGIALAVADEGPLRQSLADPDRFAADQASVGFRVAGAPRGSWAGIARAVPHADAQSSEGVFVFALRQARAVFLDQSWAMVLRGSADPAHVTSPCDHVPLFSILEQNAYYLTGAKCSVYFLGMAKRPWIDSSYSDASLASRGGMIVAHELAHSSLETGYNATARSALLKHYRASTYNEAVADILAAAGVLKTGLVGRQELQSHWCQLFCARVPFAYTPSPAASHPAPNERCDFFAATLSELYAS